MSYRDVLARSERRDETGQVIWPLAFHDRPRGMSAFGQDPKGLEAKPASPARQGAAHPSDDGHPTNTLGQRLANIIGIPVILALMGFDMLLGRTGR
jgi:hypothetical protein